MGKSMRAKPKVFEYDLGMVGGKVTVYCGRWCLDSLQVLGKKIGFTSKFDPLDCNPDDLFGLCYCLGNGNSVVWINPSRDKSEMVEAVIHEFSHAIDTWMEFYSYEDGELRARIHGGLSAKAIKDLRLLK